MKNYIFHHDDLDGKISGFLARAFLEESILIECSYSKPLSVDLTGIYGHDTRIFVLDYSFHESIMEYLFEKYGERFIWIDHHISSIQKMEELNLPIQGLREIGKCGAELTYEFFTRLKEVPKALKIIGDFDLFRTFGTEEFENTTLPFFYGLSILEDEDLDFFCQSFFDKTIKLSSFTYRTGKTEIEAFSKQILENGKIILEYEKKEGKRVCEKLGYIKSFRGLKAFCVNLTNGLTPQICGAFQKSGAEILITFYWDGEKWGYGFYSDHKKFPHVDCARIAESYGGGGHKSAAGASSSTFLQELR